MSLHMALSDSPIEEYCLSRNIIGFGAVTTHNSGQGEAAE
jgi:hypothetical protein